MYLSLHSIMKQVLNCFLWVSQIKNQQPFGPFQSVVWLVVGCWIAESSKSALVFLLVIHYYNLHPKSPK